MFVKNLPKQHRAGTLNELLMAQNFPSVCSHSGMAQTDRIEVYKKMKEFRIRIVVATNSFSRGLAFPRVTAVINYDFPAETDSYIHRMGRCKREVSTSGQQSLVISFVSSAADEEVLQQVKILYCAHIAVYPPDHKVLRNTNSK